MRMDLNIKEKNVVVQFIRLEWYVKELV